MIRKLWLLIGLMFLFLLPATVAGATTISGDILDPGGNPLSAEMEEMLDMQCATEDGSGYGSGWTTADELGIHYEVEIFGSGTFTIWVTTTDECQYTSSIPLSFTIVSGDLTEQPIRLTNPAVTGKILAPDGETTYVPTENDYIQIIVEKPGEYFPVQVAETAVAADGTYRLGGIAPGNYILRMEYSQTNQTYFAPPPSPLVVTVITQEIDLQLLYPLLKGTVKTPDGAVFIPALTNGAQVVLLDEQNNVVDSAEVRADGSYMLGGIEPGDYRIRVEPTVTGSPYTASIPEEITLSNPSSAEEVAILDLSLTNPQVEGTLYAPDGKSPITSTVAGSYRMAILDSADREIASAELAADGSYKLGGIVPGNYTIQAQVSDSNQYFNSLPQSIAITNVVQTLNLNLTTPMLQGKVSNPDNSPLTNIYSIQVKLTDLTGREIASVNLLDTAGNYVIGGVPAGDYLVKAVIYSSDDGFCDSLATPVSLTTAGSVTCNLALTTPSIKGTVMKTDGTTPFVNDNIHSVDVVLATLEGKELASYYCFDNANYSFGGIAAGNYQLQARVTAYSNQNLFNSRWIPVEVIAQQTKNQNLTLRGPDIQGVVKKPDGTTWASEPDLEIWVIAYDEQNQEAAQCMLSAGSSFSLGGLTPGTYYLQAVVSPSQAKYVFNSLPVEVTISENAAAAVQQDLTLSAPLLQGSVRKPDNTAFIPGKNSEVMVILLTAGGYELDAVMADSQGCYWQGDVPAGTYYLQAIAQGTANSYADSDLIPVRIVAGQLQQQDLTLNQVQINGTVVGPGSQLLSPSNQSINVQLSPAWNDPLQTNKSAAVGAGGSFKMGGLPEGDYWLTANYEYSGMPGQEKWTDSLPTKVHVQAGSPASVTLKLTQPQIKGQLLKPDGTNYTAIHDSLIAVTLTDEAGGYWHALAQPDGTFILGGIPAGTYQLATEVSYHPTYADAAVSTIVIMEGQTRDDVKVQLTTPQISGQVLKPDGTKIDSYLYNVQVWLIDSDDQFNQMVYLDQDGKFKFGGLPAGNYILQANISDNTAMSNSLPLTVALESGKTLEQNITLTQPRVQGKVLTPAPAGDALIPIGYSPTSLGDRMTSIALVGENGEDWTTLAQDGMFRSGGVPAGAGNYTLQATPNEMMGHPWGPSAEVAVNLGTETIKQDISLTEDKDIPQLKKTIGYIKSLYLTYEENLDPLQVPAATDFTVTVNQQAATVESLKVIYKNVILQLSQALTSTDIVSVSYTKGAKPVQDLAGNQAPAFTGQTVTMEGAEPAASDLKVELTWDKVTADTSLVAPGANLQIKATGQAGGTASAVLQYKTLYDDKGQLLTAPREAQTTITLSEITASPSQYQGSFPVAEGITQLLSLQVSLNTGSGDPQTWQASGWPLNVAAGLTITCSAEQSDLLNGAQLVVWSNSQLYSNTQTLTGAGEITLYVKPATDYQARLLSSDHRVLASAASLALQSGLNQKITLQAASLNTLRVKLVEKTGAIPVKDMILSLIGPENRVLGNLKTGTDGWTPTLSGAGDYNLLAGDSVIIKVNLGQRMYNPVADSTHVMTSGNNEVIISLEPIVQATITGKVLGPNGPLAGITINASQVLQNKTYTNRTRSAADGSYSLQLYLGAATLQAEDPTYKYEQPRAVSVEVKTDSPACNLNLQRTGRGTIAIKLFTKHLGEDWQEVQLSVLSAELYHIMLDGVQMHFWPAVVYGQPGDRVKISVDGMDYNLPAQEQTVTLDQDCCASVEFRLEESGGRVKGTLVDQNNQPMNYYCQWELLAKGSDGSYTFKKYVYGVGGLESNLPDPGDYRLRLVEAMGYDRPAYFQTDFTITAGNTLNLGNIKLMEPGVFSGQPGNTVQAAPSEVTPGTSFWLNASYKNSSSATAQSAQIIMEIPAGTECLPAYSKVNNQPVNGATLSNNRLTIPLGDVAAGQSGEASCYLRVLPDCQADTLGAAAQISYLKDSQTVTEALGSAMVRNIRLSLQAPERINSRQVYLSGRIPPGQLVQVFAGQELLGSAQPGPGGSYWEMNVALPDKGNPFLYLLHARSLDSQGKELNRTADTAVIYDINQPQLLEMTVRQGSNTITADCSQGVARFPFSVNPSYPIEVLLKFNHPDQVENVQVYLEGQRGLAANAVRGAYDLYQASVVSAGKALGAFYVSYDIKSSASAVSWEPVLTTPTDEELRRSLPPGMQDFILEGEVEVTPLNNENTEYLGKALFRLPNRNNLKVEVQIKVKLNTDFQPSQEQIAAAGTDKVYDYAFNWTESPQAKRIVSNMSGYLPQDLFVDASVKPQGFQAQDVGWVTYSQFVAQTTYDGYSTVSELNDTVAGAKGYADKISNVMSSMDDIMECPDMAADIAPQMGKALAATVIGEVGKQALNIGGKFMGAALSPAGSLVFSGVSAAAGKAIDTMVDNQIKAIPKAKCKKEKEKEKEKKNKGKGKKTANPAWIYDPSGIIYETVPDNLLSDATVSVFYQDDTQNWQLWDADWYGQVNPQLTINDGKYGWDVPAGKWQVIAQKDGYEDGRSAVLDVPPPHFDVNIPMVSRVAPTVSRVTPLLSSTLQSLEIVFDRYILTEGLDAAIIVKDKSSDTVLPGTVAPLNAVTLTGNEGGMAGAQAAKALRYNLTQTPADGTVVKLTVKSTVQSYAGTPMGTDCQTEVTMGQDTIPPGISEKHPRVDGRTSLVLPAISAQLSDSGSGIDAASIQIKLDGTALSAYYDARSAVVQALPEQGLANGTHTVELTVKDLAGNQNQASWSFTVDTLPPALTIQFQPGSITGAGMVAMSVSSDEDLSAAPVMSLLMPDGSALDLTPSVTTPSRQWSASYQLSATAPPGTYSLYVTGSDLLENQITTSNQFQVMSSLPVISLRGEADVRIIAGSTYSDPGATAVYLNTDVSNQIIVNNPVDANLPGAYNITYNVTCDSNAAQPVTRTVLVVPPAPVVSLVSGTNTIEVSGGMSGATIILYDQDNQIAATQVLQAGATSCAFTSMSAGQYFAIQRLNGQESAESTPVTIEAPVEGCFIATAAFGSKFTWPVSLLRHFRDQFLLTNAPGAAFVDFYYRHSPPIAKVIADSQGLKLMVRILLLPLIVTAWMLMHPFWLLLVMAGCIALLYHRRSRQAKA